MQFNNSLFQGGMGLLAGSMPNSGFSPWAAGLQGMQSGMAQDRSDADRLRWEEAILGQGGGQPGGGATPNPTNLMGGVPPINQAGGPMPAMGGGGVPNSAALRQRFGMGGGQPGGGMMSPGGGQQSFSGAAAPSAQPSASTSRGQGLGSEYWREMGLRQPPGAPAGAPPALTAARGGPSGVQVAALGPMGGGGAARGAGGGQVTLAPQGQPQQALGVSPGPGVGLQGLLASMDPQTRQMVAMLGPEKGASLLVSMLTRKPSAQTDAQKLQDRAVTADQYQLTGDDRKKFILEGELPDKTTGPFEGTGISAQDSNILLTADPTSNEYRLAYARSTMPRQMFDAVTQQYTTLPGLDLSFLPAPGGVRGAQGQGQSGVPTGGGVPYTPQGTGGVTTEIVGQPKFDKNQTDAATFASRMVQANNDLPEFQTSGTSTTSGLVGQFAPNTFKPADLQRFQRAEAAFVNSILRRESGAAIRDDEFLKASQEYWPQPGDKPAVLEDKARARELAIQNMTASAGRAPINVAPQSKEITINGTPYSRDDLEFTAQDEGIPLSDVVEQIREATNGQ